MNKVKSFYFNEPEIVRIGNTLANLERRTPHDAVKLLIIDEGTRKIERLKAIKETEKAQEGEKR